MAQTTKELILDLAPELSAVTDERFDFAIYYANIKIPLKGYGDNQQFVQTLYAAHLLTLVSSSGSGSGALKREKVGRVEKEYDVATSTSNDALLSTKYGKMLKPLLKVRII